MYAVAPRVKMNGNYVYIYRIEHKKLMLGPCCSYAAGQVKAESSVRKSIEKVLDEHCDDLNYWPTISTDCRDRYHNKYQSYFDMKDKNVSVNCGCESIDLLKSWFRGHLEHLHESGFVVKVYRVHSDEVYRTRSGRQCAFVKPTFPNKILSIESIL
jgi:hypothetical protein